MKRKDVLRMVIDVIDESMNDSVLAEKLYRYIDRAHKVLAKRELRPLPPTLLEDTELATYDENVEFIVNYAIWLYYLTDLETESASIFKGEMESINLYKPQVFKKFEDVYGGVIDG
ncbi:MAG: hypothetical protein RR851_13215 [Clostridium sp.]